VKEHSSDAPRIEFPCAYPVKIVGENRDGFSLDVVDLTRRYAPEITDADVNVRASREGNYCAVTITIRATGEAQLRDLHNALKVHPLVRLVL
jgi:putative lipoic acid-binding regulatory protein